LDVVNFGTLPVDHRLAVAFDLGKDVVLLVGQLDRREDDVAAILRQVRSAVKKEGRAFLELDLSLFGFLAGQAQFEEIGRGFRAIHANDAEAFDGVANGEMTLPAPVLKVSPPLGSIWSLRQESLPSSFLSKMTMSFFWMTTSSSEAGIFLLC